MVARAVAEACYDRRGPLGASFMPVLEAYVSKRPKQAEVFENLLALDTIMTQKVMDGAYLSMPPLPSALGGMSEAQVEALATEHS